jgi:hypothetical protein
LSEASVFDLRQVYLQDLEKALSRSLPEEDVAARLAEIDEHLRDGIEGRIELGLDHDSAVRDALATFGGVRKVARALVREAFAQRDAARLRWLGIAYSLFIVAIVAGPPIMRLSEFGYHSLFVLAWSSVVAFGIAAFRARRPAPIPVMTVGSAATAMLCVLIGSLWVDLTAFGGTGMVGPLDDFNRDTLTKRLATVRSSQETVSDARTALEGPAGAEEFRAGNGYRAPVVRSWIVDSQPLRVEVVKSGTQAARAWMEAGRKIDAFDVSNLENNLSAIDRAAADPLRNFSSLATQAIPVGLVAAGGTALIDLIAGGLGMAWLTSRRRRGPGGLRA